MTRDEMRAIRRQLINEYLQDNCRFMYVSLASIKNYVRFQEMMWFDEQLKAYAS